ncbi:MAG: tetratricopeptide repeat protein [Burkholderiaceae bacterium]|nr:tetratricopeptide repeat protein [Burkholderiaceae bacterium]
MKRKLIAVSLPAVFLASSLCFAASVDKAEMLNRHGLNQNAKSELIDVIFSKSSDSNRAQAYYLLGSIAFDEHNIPVALDAWQDLVRKYPGSTQARTVKDRIQELSELVGDSTKESTKSAIASSYIQHANFWSKGKNSGLTIDSSYIPSVEAATKWYDKVISEFPRSTASRIAYQGKLRTLLGWEEPGRYGSKYGLEESFNKYMPMLLDTFTAFEREHPTAATLQAFRYQIAQAYWSQNEYNKAREWLNLIVKISGERDSFYKDLAERRLQNMSKH